MLITSQAHMKTSRIQAGLFIGALALVLAGFFAWVARNGAVAHAALEQQRNNEIAAESRAFCEKWGASAGMERHARCVADLQGIRERQTQRIQEDMGPD